MAQIVEHTFNNVIYIVGSNPTWGVVHISLEKG